MSEDKPSAAGALSKALEQRITATIHERERENADLMERASKAEAEGDFRKRDYWLAKARRVNTRSGLAQLFRGGNMSQRIEAAKAAQRAGSVGAAKEAGQK